MRVYHFLSLKYGLEDLVKRRLKIARINELNDPFELLGVSLSDSVIRRTFQKRKEEFSREHGLLCFSRDWQNPVQWSHYADKHGGLCLGFDVPNQWVKRVVYCKRRIKTSNDQTFTRHLPLDDFATSILFTKFSHWSYEKEMRAVVPLQVCNLENGLYFEGFSDRLKLQEVIIGAASTITRSEVRSVLGKFATSITARKARLAFRSFRVVRQLNTHLWT